jgi:hypothetical protein
MSRFPTLYCSMSRTLHYAPPAHRPPSWTLALFANLTVAYPLLLAALLYGEWLLATYMLGHTPEPSVDDPKDIIGSSWMHLFTGLALLGLAPAGILALIMNALHVGYHRVYDLRLAARVAGLLVIWFGLFALLRYDPGSVVVWWFD